MQHLTHLFLMMWTEVVMVPYYVLGLGEYRLMLLTLDSLYYVIVYEFSVVFYEMKKQE